MQVCNWPFNSLPELVLLTCRTLASLPTTSFHHGVVYGGHAHPLPHGLWHNAQHKVSNNGIATAQRSQRLLVILTVLQHVTATTHHAHAKRKHHRAKRPQATKTLYLEPSRHQAAAVSGQYAASSPSKACYHTRGCKSKNNPGANGAWGNSQ